jgi:hypothetical protein
LRIAEACDADGFRTYPCLDLTRVLDFDLRAYFDNVRHDRLLAKVARRIDDADVMHLLKVNLKPLSKLEADIFIAQIRAPHHPCHSDVNGERATWLVSSFEKKDRSCA